MSTLLQYGRKIRLLPPNARLYLASVIIIGLGQGIHRLLFNFFVLSQGYTETFLGTLISTTWPAVCLW